MAAFGCEPLAGWPVGRFAGWLQAACTEARQRRSAVSVKGGSGRPGRGLPGAVSARWRGRRQGELRPVASGAGVMARSGLGVVASSPAGVMARSGLGVMARSGIGRHARPGRSPPGGVSRLRLWGLRVAGPRASRPRFRLKATPSERRVGAKQKPGAMAGLLKGWIRPRCVAGSRLLGQRKMNHTRVASMSAVARIL